MACMLPVHLKAAHGNPSMTVPCGKCPACRKRRADGWVFRLEQEEKVHTNSLFVTLTYDSPPISFNGFMTLDKTHVQKFFKRLRKATKCKTIKYYACGEYGGDTLRPHYHLILFDCTHQAIIDAWKKGDTDIQNGVVNGYVHFGYDCSGAAIAYVTKYMCKVGKIPVHDHDDRQPEFALMSKGLGKNYITSEILHYYGQRHVNYLTQLSGFRIAMPRYYANRIYTEYDREQIAYKALSDYYAAFEEGVRKVGGITEFYRRRHEAVARILATNDRTVNSTRNKI